MAIDVVDEIHERCRPVGWAERHDCVRPLDCIGSLKGEFFLTVASNSQLMVARRCVEHPHPLTCAKLLGYGGVASWNRISNDPGDRIQRNVVDAEPPNEFVDVLDVFLMRLWGKDGFKEPSTVMDLPDVSHLLQSGDGLAHQRELFCAVLNLLDRDSWAISCVNDAFVIFHWDKDAAIVKDRPVLPNQGIDGVLQALVEMRQIQTFVEYFPVNGLLILEIKRLVGNIKRGR